MATPMANELGAARRRSLSRASTSSMQSATTQPNLDQSFAELYTTPWLDDGDQQHQQHQHASAHGATGGHHAHAVTKAALAGVHQLTPEDIILQAASQLETNPDFADLDASMAASMGGGAGANGPPSFHHQHHQAQPHLQQHLQHHAHQQHPLHHQPHQHQHQQPLHHPSHANGLSHQQPLPGDNSFGTEASYADLDSHMTMDRDTNDDADSSLTGGLPAGAPKASRSSANNELEMRQLFSANKNRSLQDVAEELHGNERGPNSERTRQVFAMLWINQVCSKGKGSVPRGRVYANYASRCATERITVLNPASFGKLVRVLFPGLKTRRLGVRGESKYHYVNFTLAEDEPDLRDSPRLQVPLLDSVSFTQGFVNETVASAAPGAMPSKGLFTPASSAGRPSGGQSTKNLQPTPPQQVPQQPHAQQPQLEQQQQQQHQQAQAQQQQPYPLNGFHEHLSQEQQARPPVATGDYVQCLYNQPDAMGIDQLNATAPSKTVQNLFLASSADTEPFSQSDPLVLPRIEPYLPAGTDPDAAKSLAALYRSHCTSLVECIRYCKEKTFFHLFTSFQGTLTMPVQKLFANPSVAPWIEASDFVLYQRMMRIIAVLTLQVVPKPVLDTLRNISERLVAHIREAFQGQPVHVVRAKEAPATIFAGLLDRALRVNLTAHAAANMLSNPANRDQMYLDWITLVRVRKVAESVPARGMDDVVNLLIAQLRDLLDPVDVSWELESLTVYGEYAARSGRRLADEQAVDGGASNVLDRWVTFLQALPARFPYASHRDIVWCVQRVGTAVMRDLTIQQGKSFGSWWVTKCWIDEMVAFLAEQGGFLRQTSSQQDLLRNPGQAGSHTNSNSNGNSNGSSHSIGGGGSGSSAGGGGMAASQKTAPAGRDLSRDLGRHGSRYSGGSDDSGLAHMTQSQPDRAPFPSGPSGGGGGGGGGGVSGAGAGASQSQCGSNGSSHDALGMGNGPHDDSGIGIRTPDEDFPMDKYTFSTTDSQDLMVGGLH